MAGDGEMIPSCQQGSWMMDLGSWILEAQREGRILDDGSTRGEGIGEDKMEVANDK